MSTNSPLIMIQSSYADLCIRKLPLFVPRLMSQFWYSTTTGCMAFYYHMKGPQQGSLAFGLKPYNQPLIKLSMFTGDQGGEWKLGYVEVGFDGKFSINTTFQFVFEAVVGGALSEFLIEGLRFVLHRKTLSTIVIKIVCAIIATKSFIKLLFCLIYMYMNIILYI